MTNTDFAKTGGVVRTITEEITRINDELERLNNVVRVPDIAARDAITAANRYEGMYVEVLGKAKVYRLTGGITNAHWVEQVGLSAVGVPVARTDQYGVVRIGSGVNVTDDGTISVPKVNIATTTTAGTVKGGNNVAIAKDGTLSVPDVIDMISRGFGRRYTAGLSVNTTPPNDFDQLWDVDRVASIPSTGQLNGAGLGNGVLVTYGVSDLHRVQLFFSYVGRMAIRTKVNETIYDWAEVANGNSGYAPNRLEIITASSTWTAPKTCIVLARCVGGGAGGGGSGYWHPGGGGGCGKITEGFIKVTKGQTISAVIGAGGVGGAGGNGTAKGGSGGGTTSFGTISAAGGNGGGAGSNVSIGIGGIGGGNGSPSYTQTSNGMTSLVGGTGGKGGINFGIKTGSKSSSTWFGSGGNGGNSGAAGAAGAAGLAGAIEIRY